MTDPIESRNLLPLLYSVADCLCAELARSPGGAPCFCGVVPGSDVAMDYCDCDSGVCGSAWVRLDTSFPSDAFPTPQLAAKSCRTQWAARVQMGVFRCMPSLDAEGNPPTEVEQADAVRVQVGDLAAMQRALQCCMDLHKRDFIVGTYQPLGPAGGCGGGALTFTVALSGGV